MTHDSMESEPPELTIETVQIDPEFESICRQQTDEEKKLFRADVEKNGYLDPLIVWHDGDHWLLLDGHHRLKLWEMCHQDDADYMPEVQPIKLADRQAAKIWIVKHQLGRRNLSKPERIELAMLLAPSLREKGKANQVAGGEQKEGLSKLTNPPELVNTRAEVANAANVSTGTLHNYETIVSSGDDELVQQVKSGSKSIGGAAREVKERQQQSNPQPPAPASEWSQAELEKCRRLEGGKAVALNPHKEPYLAKWAKKRNLITAVGKRTRWGNPFIEGEDGDLETVTQLYAEHYLPFKPSLTRRLESLKGKALSCDYPAEESYASILEEKANGK